MSPPAACRSLPVVTFVFAVFILASYPVIAQDSNSSLPAVEWMNTYGGPDSDVAYNAVPVANDGYMVLGVTRSYGNGSYDAWLLRLDAKGEMLWNRTYGGQYGEWTYHIGAAPDGNFFFVGAAYDAGAKNNDIWLVKVNDTGDVIWSRTFGGPHNDCAFGVVPLPDGGCVITGYWGVSTGESDFFILRTDTNGSRLWDKKYNNGVQDWAKAIIATSDGGFALGGWTKSTSDSKAQAYLMKTDGNGNKLWDGAFGGVSGDTYGYGVVETDDRGYIVGGYTGNGENGGIDIFGAKVDKDGHKLWEKSTGLSKDDFGFNAVPVAGGLMFGGYSSSFDPSLWKLYLVETTGDGTIVDYRSYGPENASVKGSLTFRTADGGYLFVGNTDEYGSGKDDVFVMKLAGTPGLPVSEDIVAKAALPVAAVAAGTGLSFLALFMGRIFDYLTALMNRVWSGISDLWALLMKMPVFNALYKLVYGYIYGRFKSKIVSLLSSRLKKADAVERVPFLAGFSARELEVLAVSAVLLGLAFIVAKKMALTSLDNLVLYIFIAGFVTSFHDLAHRYYAFKYKSVAEYKFWGFGTVVMFLTALGLGVTYAVPARTIIDKADKMGVKEQAIVFLSGPIVSGILAFAFLLLVPFGGILRTIGLLGVSMNLLSAVYSLTPFQPMDGNKVYRWKKALWAATFVPFLLLYLGVTIFLI